MMEPYQDDPESGPEQEPEQDETGQDEGGQTFLANKDIMPDAKIGDVFQVRVVREHDSELELEVAKDEESPPEEKGGEEPETAPAGGMGGAYD
jgi:hypothetical protein